MKAFEHAQFFLTMTPTTDKRRVLALITDASKTDSTNHGILAQSALAQRLPDATHTADAWGAIFETGQST